MQPREVESRSEPSLVRTAYVRWQAVLDAFRGSRPVRSSPAESGSSTRAPRPDPAAALPARQPGNEPAEAVRDAARAPDES